jgi:hypothetical protein
VPRFARGERARTSSLRDEGRKQDRSGSEASRLQEVPTSDACFEKDALDALVLEESTLDELFTIALSTHWEMTSSAFSPTGRRCLLRRESYGI